MNKEILSLYLLILVSSCIHINNLYSAKSSLFGSNKNSPRLSLSSSNSSNSCSLSPASSPKSNRPSYDESVQALLNISTPSNDKSLRLTNQCNAIFDSMYIATNNQDFIFWNSKITSTEQKNLPASNILILKGRERIWINPREIINNFYLYSAINSILLLPNNLICLGMIKNNSSEIITLNYFSEEIISQVTLPQYHIIKKLAHIPSKNHVIIISDILLNEESKIFYYPIQYFSQSTKLPKALESNDYLYNTITSMIIAPDEQSIFVSSEKFIYHISLTNRNTPQRKQLDCNNYTIISLCLSPDGKKLFARVNYNEPCTETRILIFDVTENLISYKKSWEDELKDLIFTDMFTDSSGEHLCCLYKNENNPFVQTWNVDTEIPKKAENIPLKKTMWWICKPCHQEVYRNNIIIISGKINNKIKISTWQI